MIDEQFVERARVVNKSSHLHPDDEVRKVFNAVGDPVVSSTRGERYGYAVMPCACFECREDRRIIRFFMKGIGTEECIRCGNAQIDNVNIYDFS